jgi:GTPase SAR1 family protein
LRHNLDKAAPQEPLELRGPLDMKNKAFDDRQTDRPERGRPCGDVDLARTSYAAILVFSCIDQRSFDRMIQWKNELISSRGEDIKLIVVANKIDATKDRCIKTEQGEAIAGTIKAQYFEVSAKTGQGIDLLFAHVTDLLSKIPSSGPSLAKRSSRVGLQVVNGEEQPKAKGCC